MMIHSLEPLSKLVVAMMYFGDVVFKTRTPLKASSRRIRSTNLSASGEPWPVVWKMNRPSTTLETQW
jgi:hypothetical protein